MPAPKSLALILALAVTPCVAAQAASLPTQTYPGHALSLSGLFAAVEITAQPGAGGITIAADAPQEALDRLSVTTSGDKVVVHQTHRHGVETDKDKVVMRITVPAAIPLAVDDFVGTLRAGDVGDLSVSRLESGVVAVGGVHNANLMITGSGDITTGPVAGTLSVKIDGSGSLVSGPTHAPVAITIRGSGDADIARVDGPVMASIQGSGNIRIQDGRADPLSITMEGSGDFTLHGTASQQMVKHSGTGKITITGQ